MTMVNDFKPSGFVINDDLRIDGEGSMLAPEIYFKYNIKNEFYALHPMGWNSDHRVILEQWPSSGLWKEILHTFGIFDELSFCKYVQKISFSEILHASSVDILSLLQSNGYSAARFNDIIYTASLSGFKRRLYVEKNIPVKLIKLMDKIKIDLCDNLAGFLLNKEVNGNIAKEIINSWIDLPDELKIEVIQKFEILRNDHLANKKIQIGDEFRKVIFSIRFPEIQAFMVKMDSMKMQLSKNINVSIDQKFEQNKIRIYTEVEDLNELQNFLMSINDNNNIIILEQMINLLNTT